MDRNEVYRRLKITEDLIPFGSSNRPGTPLKATHITIHNTANGSPGADALAHARYLKGSGAQKRQVSWHYTVDDKRVVKHLPLSEQGWHAGTGRGNRSSVGIEICEHAGIDQKEANDRAALLTALLVSVMGLKVNAVVPHKHWSGKNCPARILEKKNGWDDFLKLVEKHLGAMKMPAPDRVTADAAPPKATGVAAKMVQEAKVGEPPPAEATIKPLPGGPSYVLNARPDVPDFRDKMFVATLVQVPTEKPLKEYLDLKLEVLDQGVEGACTGFGLAAVANYLICERGNKNCVSARMLYEMAKRYDEWTGEAYEGSSARGAMKGWNKHGVCTVDDWPYVGPGSEGGLTNGRAMKATEHPLGAYFRVDHKDIVAMHAAIAEVGILYATAMVHEGWRTVGKDGIIKFSNDIIGGHAFAIVAYDRFGFWIQNSWSETWGHKGFCHISYEDWLQNGTDVWVARLGVPISFSTSSGPVLASNYLVGDFKPATYTSLRPHVICLDNDGALASNGAFANDQETVRDIIVDQIPKITAAWKNPRILLYAHGGLVEESGFLSVLAKYQATMLAREIFPLCFVWRTGLFDTLQNILMDALGKRMPSEGLRDWLDERKDDLIEVVTSLPGRGVWGEMKENAILATRSSQGGARHVANCLQELLPKKPHQLHVGAHSAGAILMAPLLQLLATKGRILTGPMRTVADPNNLIRDEGFGHKIESCTLWAPAIRCDLFDQTYSPLMRSRQIDRLAVYALTDKAERNDNCLKLYGKSLLYLVSNAFEGARGTPILGMQKFHSPVLDGLPKTDRVYTKYDTDLVFEPGAVIPNVATESRAHGDFDDDAATLWSTLARIDGTSSVTI